MRDSPAGRFLGAALDLVGTPFRLHGRDPETGLDCIGLINVSLLAIGRKPLPPEGYRLRNSSIAQWLGSAKSSGLTKVRREEFDPGDVLLLKLGAVQHHVVIVCDPFAAVHAHAGLRRVVVEPMRFPKVPVAHWRVR